MTDIIGDEEVRELPRKVSTLERVDLEISACEQRLVELRELREFIAGTKSAEDMFDRIEELLP